jgi:tetratricopeptide (TPR) repeat protein
VIKQKYLYFGYKVVMLYQQGSYSEATKVAEEALTIAEKTFGLNHPAVATSLNNLAMLYEAQGKYAEAEPLYKRSMKIRERSSLCSNYLREYGRALQANWQRR